MGSSTTTRIRGNNSINASNSPLVILDGVPYDGNWAELNSNDVESIEILKDASSAAIYGARGANGVILIQTKKGKSGDKVKVSYNGYLSWDKAINIPEMMDGKTFYESKTEAGWPTGATEESMYQAGKSTDWLALALRTGFNQQHNVSFRGAGKSNHFYASANLSDNKGIAIGDIFKRYSFNLNFEQDLASWIKFGTSTRYGYFDRSGSNINFSSAYLMNPLGIPYTDDGSIRLLTWEDNNYSNNPLATLNEKDSDITRSFTSNNYLDITTPIPGLTYRLNTGYTYRTRLQQNYQGLDTVDGNKNGGILSISNMYRQSWLVENIISYNKEIGKHTIFLTGLYSAQSDDIIRNGISASGFPNDVMTYWQPNKASVISGTASRTTTTHISQMIRANYSYDSRYLLTATARRDGYSAFGSDRKYGIFPSLALGWNISNEPFFKESKAGVKVNALKLRLSWGKNGNEAIDAYSTLPVLRSANGNYLTDSYSSIFGFYPSQLASPLLGWETTTSWNVGLDYGFLQNRIKGSVDAYTSKTTDLLLSRTIPTINGTNTVLENVGATAGDGIEFVLVYNDISIVAISKNKTSYISMSYEEVLARACQDLKGRVPNAEPSECVVGSPSTDNTL